MFYFEIQRFADSAVTEVAPALQMQAWAASTWTAGLQKSFFNKFTGNSPENIIQIKEELRKGDGDTINIPLLMPLTGAGILGDDELEGNEEALIYRDFQIQINQVRNAVRIKGKMEEKKTQIDMRKDARTGLADWLAKYIDIKIFEALSTDPTADRIVYGGSATSEGSIGAADTFSTKLIGKAKRIAMADENTMVKPVRIDGRETYIMIIDQWQARDLVNDSTWIEAQQHANVRGETNPIFSGALGVICFFLVFKGTGKLQNLAESINKLTDKIERFGENMTSVDREGGKTMKIFINPGHGGNDCGACGNGLRESDVALKIGRRVENYLQAVGIATKLFQYDGLAEIVDDANFWNADLFISIHCNAFNGKARGSETFCNRGAGEGKSLANAIHKQITGSIDIADRGVKEAGFFVLAHTNMPAVLVETAFIDNPADAKLLIDCEDDFARAISRGVTDFLKIRKPLPDLIEKPPNKIGALSKHFSADEFTCHHCGVGSNLISPRLIELLEALGKNIGGKPLHINSGYRCPAHNRNVGGVPNSQHVLGTAADAALPAGLSFGQFKWHVLQLPFDGIGFYPDDFIHLDVRDGGVGSHICWYG